MRILINGGIALGCLLIGLSGTSRAATFGSIVQIQGEVSDIALDQGRGEVYAANFTANRIEVVSMSNLSLKSPMIVAEQPSTLALSPDGRFLVVGHYHHFPNQPPKILPNPPCDPEDPTFQVLTVIDFANSGKQTRLDPGGACVLAVAFGNSPQALVVSTDGVRLLDPSTGLLQVLTLTNFGSAPLPVPWATFPPNILKSSAGTSGDGNVIYALVDAAGGSSWQPSQGYAVAIHSMEHPPRGLSA
jgi:DNA-binding beta-propeller fold protein YncE